MEPVLNPASSVYENICHLKVARRNLRSLFRIAYFNSTAFLYRERFLITAAHNVYSNSFSRVKGISVSCGAAAYDPANVTETIGRDAIRVASGYSFGQSLPGRYRRDFAVIRLSNPVRTSQPFILSDGLKQIPSSLQVAGYPGDDDDATGEDGEHMYAGSGTGQDIDGCLLNYSIDTEKGVSGAPIWTGDQPPVVIAIHVGGTERCAQGLVIDAAIRPDIDAMIAELDRGA